MGSECFILNFKVPQGGEKSGSLNCFGLLQHELSLNYFWCYLGTAVNGGLGLVMNHKKPPSQKWD